MCATGELRARFINVESEYSAMAACIGAAVAGVRTFTATSSHGLAFMHELLHWASGARLPIVMANVNRALAVPWSLLAEHTDSLSQRDTGWLQIYCEDNQEVLDSILQAYYIAERVRLPCMVNLEGFYLSYISEPVHIPEQEQVDAFLPAHCPAYELDPDRPAAFFGATFEPTMLYRFRRDTHQGLEKALRVAREADEDFHRAFGRRYGLLEGYRLVDAQLVLVATGTSVSTARTAVDRLRDRGAKVGLLKLRLFRPLPADDIRSALRGVPKVAILDRSISLGAGGILCQELKSVLYRADGQCPAVFGLLAGLGGIDVTPDLICEIAERALRSEYPTEEPIWIEVNR
jgi:pyruvate ferredoxin oxidoreductase alpha subunit